jgi:plastocyanin
MARTYPVTITNFKFDPQQLAIAIGDTVEWTNMSTNQQHSATSDDNGQTFDSKLLSPGNPGQKFSHKFETSGQYPYHCTKHPGMKATIVVT